MLLLLRADSHWEVSSRRTVSGSTLETRELRNNHGDGTLLQRICINLIAKAKQLNDERVSTGQHVRLI